MKTTNSLTEYISKNLARKNVHWRIFDGKAFFELFPLVWMHEESFDDFYPKYEYKKFNDKGANPDKTKV
jgi:hypothetical protein